MSQQIKNKVGRLHFLHQLLLQKVLPILEIQQQYQLSGWQKSTRQIHRDLNDIQLLISSSETLASHYVGKIKYYLIQSNDLPTSTETKKEMPLQTHFYEAPLSATDQIHLQRIQEAINSEHVLQIGKLKNDETGDNFSFTTKKIKIVPVRIILHRNSYFIGGYHILEKAIVFYSIRQLVELKILPLKCVPSLHYLAIEEALKTRFGITKNIDSNCYTIKIELANVIADFLAHHHWHATQQFSKQSGKTIVTFQCGINRELLGWLFQWLYNIKILEPPILKDYFEKTIHEISAVHQAKKPLVYRNIFGDEKKL
jgi:predicted DNA-binding transcriptional regulator YafY